MSGPIPVRQWQSAQRERNGVSCPQCGGASLSPLWGRVDRVPLWNGNHVSIRQLCECMARYLYLPRLRDENVLLAATQEGVASLSWGSETFAYAEAWDEQRPRYQGLRAAQSTRVVVDDRSLLVKPEVAAAQLAKATAATATRRAMHDESGK